LVRNAIEERNRNKPPHAFRELFRALRELLLQVGDGDEEGDDGFPACAPPRVIRSIRKDGWPTPTGTLCPSLPHTPTPSSSARSWPIIFTRCIVSGPLPIRVAPFTGAVILPSSIGYASVAEN